ncbi:MAG: pilus assembly protein [Hyphomicrobiaceae bacterium]|nr:pilus assembly protein [Hyphomicrobiaceae bacterium]MCC0008853.1 pilus assembly protein [Hyphomicrobiaceae bacterium]
MTEKLFAGRHRLSLRRLFDSSRHFKRNENGATAIEFAIVLGPFLMFTFGIITIGLHYLATNSLEKAVHDASRQIRTGQAQNANMTADDFKSLVCNQAAPHINCGKLQVHLSSYDSWKDVVPPECIDGDTRDLSAGSSGSDPITDEVGGASKKVLVTACYDWEVAKYLPFLFWDDNKNSRTPSTKLSDGGLLLQTSTVFQTEPYE